MSSPPTVPIKDVSRKTVILSSESMAPKLESQRLAAFWMCSATLLWVAQDSISRILLQSYPIFEVAFARFFVHALLIMVFVLWRHPSAMLSKRPALQILRSCLLLALTVLAMASLKIMPFVDYTAVAWTAPVLVTALSVWILGEKVGFSAWLSVFAGMSGAMIIINPFGIGFSLTMVLPLICALTGALYQITTRMLKFTDSALTTFFYTALAGAIICAFFIPFIGVMPNLTGAALMLMLGLLGAISHFCLIRAMSLAPANTMAPLGYTSLIWANLFSLTIFGEIPSVRTLFGAGLIAAAGLGILSRKAEG
jgi:drug/metabolite transporter (DMT)-like permease